MSDKTKTKKDAKKLRGRGPDGKPNGRGRPEGGKPCRKATNDEVEERTEEVCAMLANKFTRTDVIRAFRQLNDKVQKELNPSGKRFVDMKTAPPGYWKYDLDWRTIDRYVRRAKDLQIKRSRKTRADALAESVAYWESVVRDGKSSRAEKNFAQKQLDDVYGVRAPRQLRVTTPPGQPMVTKNDDPTDRPLERVSTSRLLQLAELDGSN